MESANILQAIEDYRQQLETVTITPNTRYFPTHTDPVVQTLKEFHQVGQQLWGHRDNGHA
jgi:hypothetical protein